MQVNRAFFDRVSFNSEPNQSVLALEREVASYPGSCGREKEEPGMHCSRMCLIKEHKLRGF